MSLIDFILNLACLILNLACLLLWLNWLALGADPLARASAATLAGTLRKADTARPKRWKFLAGLILLLYIRGVLYWQIGSAVQWTPSLRLGLLHLSFRSDFLHLMLLYSALGFVVTLAVFYLWLLLLSVINARLPDLDPMQKLVRQHLGWVERWPRIIKLLLPFVVGGLLWFAIHPVLVRVGVLPGVKGGAQLAGQAAMVGLLSYLGLKFLIIGLLLLHLLNSYVYMGNHPLWNFISASARHLLAPLQWLRVGRIDLSPVLGIALVVLVSEAISRPSFGPYRNVLYRLMPF